jgi:hypothetical protein
MKNSALSNIQQLSSARSEETIRERTLLLLYWSIGLISQLELLHSGLIQTPNFKLHCLIFCATETPFLIIQYQRRQCHEHGGYSERNTRRYHPEALPHGCFAHLFHPNENSTNH